MDPAAVEPSDQTLTCRAVPCCCAPQALHALCMMDPDFRAALLAADVPKGLLLPLVRNADAEPALALAALNVLDALATNAGAVAQASGGGSTRRAMRVTRERGRV